MTKQEEALIVLNKYANDYLTAKEDYPAFAYAMECVKEHIVWHPYPEEKPSEDGYYLVTARTDWVDCSTKKAHLFVTEKEYCDWFCGSDEYVTAWAELPKPYQKEGAEE